MTKVLSIVLIFCVPLVYLVGQFLPLLVECHHLEIGQQVTLVLHEVKPKILKWEHA